MPTDQPTPRQALVELCASAAAGTFRLMGGAHAYDEARATTFRAAAVMLLFTPTAGPAPALDLFLVRRAEHLRHHPGEISLPGGRVEEQDPDVTAAALRETQEETGLDPARVEVLGVLPPVLLPVSANTVTPVLGWGAALGEPGPVAPGEVLHTVRVGVADLLDPRARATVSILDRRTAGFRTGAGWVWGFTGNLLDHVFTELGWTRPWDTGREVPMRYDARSGRVVPA